MSEENRFATAVGLLIKAAERFQELGQADIMRELDDFIATVHPLEGGPFDKPAPEVAAPMPPAVRVALRVLLNHVEPGWENCQFVVQSWLDDAVPAAAVERLEPQRDSEGKS